MLRPILRPILASSILPIIPKPDLVWEFRTGLPANLALARNSSLFYRDETGLLASVASNAWAGHHSPDLVPRGLPCEGAVGASIATMAFASWTAARVTLGTGAAGPDGTTASVRALETAVDNTHQVTSASVLRTANLPYTLAYWAKPAGRDWTSRSHGTSTVDYADVATPALGGTVQAVSVGRGNEAWANSWYRTHTTWLNGANITAIVIVRTNSADDVDSFLGDITKGLDLALPVFRQEAFPSSYCGGDGSRAAQTVTGTFATRTPSALRIVGYTAPGMATGVDQHFAAFTDGDSAVINIYRQASDKHLIIDWGGTPYDAGLIADSTGFDIAVALDGLPPVNTIHVGTDEDDANHWYGAVTRIELA